MTVSACFEMFSEMLLLSTQQQKRLQGMTYNQGLQSAEIYTSHIL
jgi:hypothetical protein